jgi:hypothetical protein
LRLLSSHIAALRGEWTILKMNENEKIKYIIQDCHMNFLVGSGLSAPYLRTLGDIENLLTELGDRNSVDGKGQIIRASLYKKYFNGAIAKNLDMLDGDEPAANILENYRSFLTLINSILLKRKSTILSKEANVFTTNVDVFLEKALEDVGVEYNDGFNGRFRPLFSLSNFKKSRSKRSLHYDDEKKVENDDNNYLNLIVDEAHNILSEQSERESEHWRDYRLETFEEIMKEGRKFGVFLTIASQRPADISPTIISQLHNYFVHRLINNEDIRAVEKTISYLDKV